MARADFYILEQTEDVDARLPIACRLCDKAFQQNHGVYIHVEDEATARKLDHLLWTQRDISFIPHQLVGENTAGAGSQAIEIGWQSDAPHHQDILLNLRKDVPEFYGQFKRIMEIVPSLDEYRQISREHYRFYQEQGLELHSHKL